MRAALVSAALLSSCMPQATRLAGETPWPQVTIAAPVEEVRGQVISAFAQSVGTITKAEPNLVRAEGPMDSGQATMARVFFGCGTCSEPRQVIQFVMAETSPGVTLLTVQYWNEIDTPRHGWQRHEITSRDAYLSFTSALQGLKARLESPAK